MTADTALRLARCLGTSAAYWMNMQAQHDLERAEAELGKELRKIPSVRNVKSAARSRVLADPSVGHHRQVRIARFSARLGQHAKDLLTMVGLVIEEMRYQQPAWVRDLPPEAG